MKKPGQETKTHMKNMKPETKSHCFSVGITWVDAPLAQFAKIDSDFKLRCKVQANPAANIDWLKESVIISSGEFILLFCHQNLTFEFTYSLYCGSPFLYSLLPEQYSLMFQHSLSDF